MPAPASSTNSQLKAEFDTQRAIQRAACAMTLTQSSKLTAFALSASIREQIDKEEGLYRNTLPARPKTHKWRDKNHGIVNSLQMTCF